MHTSAVLSDRIAHAQLALFVGADLPSALTGLPGRADLACGLAEPRGQATGLSLATTAQRVAQGGNRFEFTDYLGRQLETVGRQPQLFHQLIVQLPIQAIVTTAYDNLLELAFQQAGEPNNRLVRGSDLAFVDPRRRTLIKLYGDLQQRDTLIVTEDDHYGLVRNRDKESVLDEVRGLLRRNAVLFLGYNLADPDFHLLWREVLDRMGRFALGAYAVSPGMPPDERRVWEDRQVQLIDVEPLAFLEELAAAVAGAPASAPTVIRPPKPSVPPPETRTTAEPLAFTLRFVLQQGVAQITWEADVLGRRVSTYEPPYDAIALPLVIKALDALQWPAHPWRGPQFDQAERDGLAALGLWDGQRVVPAAHQRVGRALYAALTADPAGAEALATVRNHATALGVPLTYLLRFPPDATGLAALPWEALWDDHGALLLNRGRLAACVRYLDLPQALPPTLPPGRSLRILAVAPEAGIPPDVRAAEREARKSAWAGLLAEGAVTMEELSPVVPQTLVDRLQSGPPVNVVHFYGHGRYVDGQGALLFDASGGGKTWLNADRVAALLGEADVRLVMLHACHSAMVSEAGLLTGVAPALSAAGVPAVIAMQLTIRIPAATRFAEVVYRALARGKSLQRAVSQARQALYVEESDGVSWYVPTLTIRARDTGSLYLIGES